MERKRRGEKKKREKKKKVFPHKRRKKRKKEQEFTDHVLKHHVGILEGKVTAKGNLPKR